MNPDPVAPPTVRDYFRILARRWWVIVLGIVGFAILAVAYSYKGPTIYKSSAEVRFTSNDSSTVAVNAGSHANAGSADRDVLSEVEVIKAVRFKNHIISLMHLQPKAIKQVNVSNVLNTNVIKITIGMASKQDAVNVADKYASVYVQQVEAQQAALTQQQSASLKKQLDTENANLKTIATNLQAEATRVDNVARQQVAAGHTPQVSSALLQFYISEYQAEQSKISPIQQQYDEVLVNSATSQPTVSQIADGVLAKKASQPQPVKYGIIGILVGLILGIAGAFGFELLTDTVRSRQDVERFSRLPVLAMVPRRGQHGDGGDRPIALNNPGAPGAEAYRAARAGVQFLSMQAPMRRVLVAGLRPNDHQDVAAANLAVTLAAAGSRVVLVDADLRNGQIHARFGLAAGTGLTSVLLGDSSLADALRPVEVPGGALRVLGTGPLPPNPADLVASDSLATVLSQLADGADFVVVSSSPLLPYNDALALARHADGVVIVATARRTRKRHLADGAAKLRRVGAPAIGVILDRGAHGADAYEDSVESLHT